MKWLNVILIISLLANVAIMSYHWYKMNQILNTIQEMKIVASKVSTTVSGLTGIDTYLNVFNGAVSVYKKIPFHKLKFWG